MIAVTSLVTLLLLWFGIAYGGLPRLWSHHEHKRIGSRDEIVSCAGQDIPADPINLRLEGRELAIARAFRRAGWAKADDVSVRSAVKIAASVVLDRAYVQALASSLYVHDRVQDHSNLVDGGLGAFGGRQNCTACSNDPVAKPLVSAMLDTWIMVRPLPP